MWRTKTSLKPEPELPELSELDRLLNPASAGELVLPQLRDPVKKDRLELFYSPELARFYEEAEKETEREWAAAQLLQGPECVPPFLVFHYQSPEEAAAWWERVYGASESELTEMANAAARRYRKARWFWRRKQREEALRSYVRMSVRLSKARGLSTAWI